MTGAENLMNTIINSLSMIDRGFTVTLTVQPHDWDCDVDDYDEEDDDEDDELRVSEEVIKDIKEFARSIDEGLLKEKYSCVNRSMGDDVNDVVKDKPSWPRVGDLVWYKTMQGNNECGKVKVICHNTIQLEGNVTLERKDCMKAPFNIGGGVWFVWLRKIKHGRIVSIDGANTKVCIGDSTYCLNFSDLFATKADLLRYLNSTADE